MTLIEKELAFKNWIVAVGYTEEEGLKELKDLPKELEEAILKIHAPKKCIWSQDDNYYLLNYKAFQIQIQFYNESFLIYIEDIEKNEEVLDTSFQDYSILKKTICEFVDCASVILDMPSMKQLQAAAD